MAIAGSPSRPTAITGTRTVFFTSLAKSRNGASGIAIGGMMAGSGALLWAGVLVVLGSIALLWAGAQHVLGAGYVAILEVFGLAGNLLSYKLSTTPSLGCGAT